MQKTNILMVCLGNICRSPVADGIMRKIAKDHQLQLFIDSAGTSGLHSGEAPDRRSQMNAKKNGVDISDLRSRKICKRDLVDFDLIYVMDKANMRDVLSLCETETQSRKVRLFLDELYPGEGREVPDPWYGGEEGFEQVFQLILLNCNKLAEKFK